jgi:guanylate kinase
MKLNNRIQRSGILFVISSPSGAGKTTLARKLIEIDNDIELSISVTTRQPRKSEINNRDYIFVDEKSFRKMIKEDKFLEHAEVFGNKYGTLKQPINEKLKKGKDILFDIDWQGTQQLMNSVQDDLVKIFVLPPSAEELEKRLLKRNQDTEDTVKKRMSKASDEISHYAEYDYIIINENFDESLKRINSILIAEGLKRTRQNKIQDMIKSLRDDLL